MGKEPEQSGQERIELTVGFLGRDRLGWLSRSPRAGNRVGQRFKEAKFDLWDSAKVTEMLWTKMYDAHAKLHTLTLPEVQYGR